MSGNKFSTMVVDSGGMGGAPKARLTRQRVTPLDGSATVGSENNRAIDISKVPPEEISCYQGMNSQQVFDVYRHANKHEPTQRTQLDFEGVVKITLMSIIANVVEENGGVR